ncbi:MAG: YigZ family protein [Candidatus Delongbacteria bacterium]|nr:YigZ family protein [Candidatus Delongbacteria bacterium]
MDSSEDPDIYYSLPLTAPVELKVKRSRFIARGFPAVNSSSIRNTVNELSRQEYKANHNCWAARLLTADEPFNDDGEPSGTAGIPILQVLRGARLQNSLVVVTRFFGGIKLGSGGLARAYGESTRLLLQSVTPLPNLLTDEIILHCAWNHKKTVYHLLGQYAVEVLTDSSQEEMRMRLQVRHSRLPHLQEELITALRGQVTFTVPSSPEQPGEPC